MQGISVKLIMYLHLNVLQKWLNLLMALRCSKECNLIRQYSGVGWGGGGFFQSGITSIL